MVQNLSVVQVVHDDAVVLTVTGEVDIGTVLLLDKELAIAGLLALPPRCMVVDLRDVWFLGAAGLTALVAANRSCRARGAVLRIVANNRAVLRPLTIVGLVGPLWVVPNLRPQWTRRPDVAAVSR